MAISIEKFSGKAEEITCRIRGTGSDAGRKVRVKAQVPCATTVTPPYIDTTLPSDGTHTEPLEFSAPGSSGKTCNVTISVLDPAGGNVLKNRTKILSL